LGIGPTLGVLTEAWEFERLPSVFLGTPNLAENIWLYRGVIDSISTTLQEGR
jgi:hypothetical protein